MAERETLEQQRARDAWDCVTDARNRLAYEFEDYVKTAKGLPGLIMNSGLMQAMAFLEQKEGRHAMLGEHLRRWLHERFPDLPAEFGPFMEKLMDAEPRVYQEVTAEAFAWLKWLRQMAAARQGEG